ncbi:MAG: hypothetical protein EXS35_14420 [Pedosphaera sp.]|nr:hypothetical protein [Pedosphaera sp.]
MKQIVMLGLVGMMAGALYAAESSPKEKVTTATKQVGDKDNYSWTTSTKEADGSPGKLGPIEGKAEKGGVTFLGFSISGLPVEVCMKGEKGAAKALEGWQTFDEIAATGGTADAVIRYLRTYQTPVAESARLIGKATDLKEADGAISGELKEEVVKEMLLFGTRRREGQDAPKMTDPKGTIKFWIKDGALTKYEIKVQGKVAAGERETEINRTTTVEIKDVGTTKLEVSDEAKQKLS